MFEMFGLDTTISARCRHRQYKCTKLIESALVQHNNPSFVDAVLHGVPDINQVVFVIAIPLVFRVSEMTGTARFHNEGRWNVFACRSHFSVRS